ncbi:MAG: PEP/pyruvate-binding domain-containing protein, partial [Caulobacteraceae bacterium]|nr:PEP/pyruvate-binding domain-containing protein [Caulobacteraceae bacterium]
MLADKVVTTRWVYSFGGGGADGDASMKNLLGGKGANLAEMSALGLPVPPGFTITTEACTHYYANGRTYPSDLKLQVADGLAKVEALTGKVFGDPSKPLLVSVRSGARASMPGMMDTVLNLGLNDDTVEGLAKLSGDRRFAFDSYRRFIQMYSNVVLDLDHHMFEEILDDHKDRLAVSVDTALTASDWEAVVADYKKAVQADLGHSFPQDPHDQLWGAVGAVFASWMNDRAKFYRRMHDIPESWGTAVNVQSMVF